MPVLAIAVFAIGLSGAVRANEVPPAQQFPLTVADVMVVDCLLPGQVRRVGKIKGFLTARRPARLSQFECAYRGGEFVEYDRASLDTSIQVWQAAAEQGDPDAMNTLGEAYAKGLGRSPDFAAARTWFERAAELGSLKALQNLGHLYENGLGVEIDRDRALDYFRKALGNAETLVYSSDAIKAAELRAEIESLRAEQARSDRERAALRGRADALAAELEQSRRQLATLRAEYALLRKQSTESGNEMWRLMEDSLAQREREIGVKQSELELLHEKSAQTREPFVRIGPDLTLRLDQPVILAARGRPVALVESESVPLRVRGRAEPVAAVAELRVDGQSVPVDAEGGFELEIGGRSQREISVVARSRNGNETLASFLVLPAAEPGQTPLLLSERRPVPRAIQKGAQRALLVAVSGYQAYPGLPTPRADAELLANVLQDKFGFEVRTLVDPTRLDLLLALHNFRQSLGNEDSGLIYFAGHGEMDESKKGYWIPSDGRQGDPKSWIANSVITDMLAVSDARHLLVVADSCYSGTLARVAAGPPVDALPKEHWQAWAEVSAVGRSRVAITSGGLRPVPEAASSTVSTFAGSLERILRDAPSLIEAQRVFAELVRRLASDPTARAFGQRPEMAPLQFAGHERGELFFVPRDVPGQ